MANIGNDFLLFLKAYYPDDVAKLSDDKVDDSVLNAILNKHKSNFEIWLQVPESIRNEYFGRVPEDILDRAKYDNNLTLDECRNIEANRYIPSPYTYLPNDVAAKICFNNEDMAHINNMSDNIISKGYTYKTAMALSALSTTRDKLRELHNNGEISYQEYKDAHRKTREQQNKKIKNEWIENQPEKMLLNIAKRLERGQIDKDTALPQMFEMMSKVKEQGRDQELKNLIESPNSRYDKWSDENKALFSEIMQAHNVGTVAQRMNEVKEIISAKGSRTTTLSTNLIQGDDMNHTTDISSQVFTALQQKHNGR